MLSIVQLSRFFLCSFSSDSFYILSKALSFVKNFFNFFHFLFCEAFSQRVSSYIISFVSVFVKNFFDFFQKLFWYYFDTLFSCFPNYGLQFSPNIRQDFSRIKRRRRDLNPRAATNDLLPFQGSPFGQLGYFSTKRRGWDSNPRALSDKRFSRPPRYDHFDTSPYLQQWKSAYWTSPVQRTLWYHMYISYVKTLFYIFVINLW